MTSIRASVTRATATAPALVSPVVLVTAALFTLLFARPATMLAHDWWTNPEAGHGLLLAPVALWLGWKRGLLERFSPAPAWGVLILVTAVLMRGTAELAAELFTMRFSMVLAGVGLIVYFRGWRQALAWWLPIVLLTLSIPLPELVISALALPLQFKASALGTKLLEWRQVPVALTGNVIQIPGHQLFVTEACSGLRSLNALLALAVLMGGLWLDRSLSRILLVLVAIPVAILINGVRVFLTGFLVYFVDPKLGTGFMHLTEGWLLFLVSLVMIGATALGFRLLERMVRPPHSPPENHAG
jgi:exosortase